MAVSAKITWPAALILAAHLSIATGMPASSVAQPVAEGLTPAQVESLTIVGKLWGYLKYHHPAVTSGALDWDAELLQRFPAILEAGERAPTQALLLQWVDSLGELPPCDPCASPPERDVHLRPRLAWLGDRVRLGSVLSERLALIHERRVADQQSYATAWPAGNANFSREEPYADLEPPDLAHRILALFRFWNIVEYWSPYRDLVEPGWDEVLAEFLPRMAAADSLPTYARELMALVARVEDSHANVWNALQLRPPVGPCTLPVKLRWIEDEPTVVGWLGAAVEPSLRIGDVVRSIAGRNVSDIVQEWSPYVGASNQASRRRNIAWTMFQGSCGDVPISVLRDGIPLEILATRVELPNDAFATLYGNDRPGDAFQMLPGDVAYLKASAWTIDAIPTYLDRAATAQGLIIDLRGYPAEFALFPLGSHFVERPTEFGLYTRPDFSNPGTFLWSAPRQLMPEPPAYRGRIAILVDETTQSQAEGTATAFRSTPNAIIVGSQTSGANGNMSWITLPGGYTAPISGLGIFTADRSPTQRIGIVPDVRVEATLAGVLAGRDEVLDAAVRELLQPGSARD